MTIQHVWSSTLLGWLKDCPRKFQYAGIFGWRSRHLSFALRFGQEYQYGLEQYDRLVADGVPHEEAIAEIVKLILVRTWDDGKPWGPEPEDKEPNRNRMTLIRSLIWKMDKAPDDPAKTVILADGKPAVELSFQMDLGLVASDGQPYLFAGHLDRVVEFAGETFVLDNKHTTKTVGSQYFRQYEPHNQMSFYTLASRVVFSSPVKGVLIDAAQVAVGFTRFERGVTYRTEAQLEEWLADTKYWIGEAEKFAIADHYPMNDMSCYLCQFKSICSKDPAVREAFLESDFVKDKYDPLELRT